MLERIKALCEKNQISLAQLEKNADISNGTIAKWHNSDPKISNVKKVADYFGVTIDYIVNGNSVRKEDEK